MKVVLVNSPLLGPSVWRSTGAALVRLGWDVQLPQPVDRTPVSPDDVLENLLGQLDADETTVLVAHSNAGLYVPALVERLAVVASVFVDASLPPTTGSVLMAPLAQQDRLKEMVDEAGLLPPWTHWWPEAVVGPLFPDAAARAAVEAEQCQLPLSYFTAGLSVPDGWSTRPSAYLAFSEPYQRQLELARSWGWPVRTHPGSHLQPLAAPDAVAASINELLGRLGKQPDSRG